MAISKKGWGPEDHEQYKVVQYVKVQYPWALFTHIPNEAKRSVFGHVKMKALGVVSGAPDLLFFEAFDGYFGLAIEMKSEKGKLTKAQRLFIGALENRGWLAHCCHSFEEAKPIIDRYLNEKQTHGVVSPVIIHS